MDKYKQLEKAIVIATNAHSGQFDKSGKPYILHPLYLMKKLLFDPQLATMAILHDTVEDTNVTFEYLGEQGISARVINALRLLTHDKKTTSYEDYIEGICSNYDAIRVKRKDLEHNSQITRLIGISEKDEKRNRKYHKAFLRLKEAKKMFLR